MNAALLLTLAAPATAQETLLNTLKAYQNLKSFSMRIVHDNSSVVFPGQFVQTFKWKKGNRFELVVTKPPAGPERPADYYCDGKTVLSLRASGRTSQALKYDKGASPGFETSTGILFWALVWPQRMDQIKNPTKEYAAKISFEFGTTTTWKGYKVREVQMVNRKEKRRHLSSFFVSPDSKRLIGFQWQPRPGAFGTAQYLDQKFDPGLPASLGKGPR